MEGMYVLVFCLLVSAIFQTPFMHISNLKTSLWAAAVVQRKMKIFTKLERCACSEEGGNVSPFCFCGCADEKEGFQLHLLPLLRQGLWLSASPSLPPPPFHFAS
ncbi:Hypothetical predicted protein [Podarcis lilfordi]|uniref:Secreted protein n=1 Tax=Podarcis lilfordi TaxID=74358 RepID=A0AA35L6W0_9SAUR|nr:Hypothetical predicted protein [Podarcis lilfordi]